MGAWIETRMNEQRPDPPRGSHPTWVRGLKLCIAASRGSPQKSHPTWVRGLKQNNTRTTDVELKVAPYVGAWIET